MVVGLDKFAEHFAEYGDRYVLIGGVAAWLVLEVSSLSAILLDEDYYEFLHAHKREIEGVPADFLQTVEEEVSDQLLKHLGIAGVSPADVFGTIRAVYDMTDTPPRSSQRA